MRVYCTEDIQSSPPLVFSVAKATFEAIARTYTYLTPDFWQESKLGKPPFQEFTDYLSKTQRTPAVTTAQAEP